MNLPNKVDKCFFLAIEYLKPYSMLAQGINAGICNAKAVANIDEAIRLLRVMPDEVVIMGLAWRAGVEFRPPPDHLRAMPDEVTA